MATVTELRALAHPLRLRLLSLLTGAALSAAEAGRELGIPQANLSYHLRVLERAGLVTVVETERVRGGDAKRYRYDAPAPDPGRAPADHRGALMSEEFDAYLEAMIGELRRRSRRRGEGLRSSTDAELWVDPRAWAQVVRHVEEAAIELHAAAQPPRTRGTVPVSMTAVLFRMSRP